MSLKKFISGLLGVLANFFHNLPSEAKQGVGIGEQIVQQIKSHEGEIKELTDLIPGTVDDKISAAIQERLPVILTNLQLVGDMKGETDPVKIVNAAIGVLKSLEGKSEQWDFYDAIATQVGVTATSVIAHGTTVVQDLKVLWNDVKYVMKWFHDHKGDIK